MLSSHNLSNFVIEVPHRSELERLIASKFMANLRDSKLAERAYEHGNVLLRVRSYDPRDREFTVATYILCEYEGRYVVIRGCWEHPWFCCSHAIISEEEAVEILSAFVWSEAKIVRWGGAGWRN